MKIFLCRDSIEGILCGVYDAWASRAGHANVRLSVKNGDDMELFAEYIEVEEDRGKAEKVMRTLKRRLHAEDFQALYQALLSADQYRADSIYRVIVLALSTQRRVLDALGHPDVCRVFELSRKTGNEAHRYLQFTRFRELENGALFAEISPENRVLPLIGEHFANRLPLENFLIYDNRHQSSLFHASGREWVLMDMPEGLDAVKLNFSQAEEEIKGSWQAFFDAVAIQERKNKNLQRQFLPMKFRAYMTEKFDKTK